MENKVLQRLREFIKSKSLTIKAFGESIDVSENTFKTMFSRDSNPSLDLLVKISSEYPDFSLRWILKGEGDMYTDVAEQTKSEETERELEENNNSVPYEITSEPLREYLPHSNFKLVPLINLDVAGGSRNQEVDTAQYIEKYVPFTDAYDNDIACMITSNSMTPVYNPGSVVLLRKIELWREYIEYGQVYVVDLIDGRRLIKQVKKCKLKDKFSLISFNKEFEEEDIPTKIIYSMWLVVSKYEKLVM